ncbi:MAG: flagellar hook-associated protein 3 [Spirochaetales bacterium]|nr:MAG: flagellar hook-associated protein 3 [Spirochaetales bacterium]
MNRVSTDMNNDNMQYYMKLREWKMNELENKIGGQTRIKNLRDDPVAAAHAVKFDSKIFRIGQFADNASKVQGDLRVAEGYLQEAVSITQRVRELAITGAQGTFTRQDTSYMAEEVDQLLKELIEIGNARAGDGTTIFSGDRQQSLAYKAALGSLPGVAGERVVSLEYVGTTNENQAEISDGNYITANFPGNAVFWAEPQVIISGVNATAYKAPEDSAISVSGNTIPVKAGDNISAIIARINDSGAPVRAKLDPVRNSLVLETTTPHQLWLEDLGQGKVLQSLGILKDDGSRPPQNVASDARISGGSLFDMVMYVRDNLYQGNQEDLGGAGIRGIDSALNNMLTSVAELGARDERLQVVSRRLERESAEMTGNLSRETDIDMAQAITDLKMMEFVHKAALQAAGRVLSPTLLDFMR